MFRFVQLNAFTAQIRGNKMDFFFMVESFMACYFNYFHFYTMLWNICGPVYIEKCVHFGTSDVLHSLKPSFLPPRTPKSLIISIFFLVSNWPSKMFVMVMKKLGDHFKNNVVVYMSLVLRFFSFKFENLTFSTLV